MTLSTTWRGGGGSSVVLKGLQGQLDGLEGLLEMGNMEDEAV